MIKITSPSTREEFKAYYDLRYKVLREPWGQPRGTEKDDYEPVSQHFMAVDDQSGKIVGVIKLMEKETGVGWLSHLAVDPHHQRQGIGQMLLEKVEAVSRQQQYTSIGAMSRLNTTSYFEKFGYHMAGIPSIHFGVVQVVWMEKKLG
jgi:N-acetylglutamate synthase-like GNAT family acetyltransferase